MVVDQRKIILFSLVKYNITIINNSDFYISLLIPMNLTLVILAAGMGSRYGGQLKQIDAF
jgi:hypothetical protein